MDLTMNKKYFDTLSELEDFILGFQEQGKFIFNIQSVEKRYFVQWEEQKYYVAQDGKSYPDEVWVTQEQEMIQIQDIEVEHLRNILRRVIRKEREYRKSVEDILDTLQELSLGEEADDESDTAPPSTTFHWKRIMNIIRKDVDDTFYSIPENMLDTFVELQEDITEADIGSDDWFDAKVEFRDLFGDYVKHPVNDDK